MNKNNNDIYDIYKTNLKRSLKSLDNQLAIEKNKLKLFKPTDIQYNIHLKNIKLLQEQKATKEEDCLFDAFKFIKEYDDITDITDDTDSVLTKHNKKINILNEYKQKLDNTDAINREYILTDYCKVCKSNLMACGHESVCSECGLCYKHEINGDEGSIVNNISFDDIKNYSFKKKFTYQKISHFEECLKRFQSLDQDIPQEIIDKVKNEAKKENVRILDETKVKYYLKKLHLNQYYDNIIGIINIIHNRPPIKLPHELEDKIILMFKIIQEPYEMYKPKGRKNFLSYNYTLRKFFEILDLPEFAVYFPLLKSSEKLIEQDRIFKMIIQHLIDKNEQPDVCINWRFIPSI